MLGKGTMYLNSFTGFLIWNVDATSMEILQLQNDTNFYFSVPGIRIMDADALA